MDAPISDNLTKILLDPWFFNVIAVTVSLLGRKSIIISFSDPPDRTSEISTTLESLSFLQAPRPIMNRVSNAKAELVGQFDFMTVRF